MTYTLYDLRRAATLAWLAGWMSHTDTAEKKEGDIASVVKYINNQKEETK